MFSKYIVQSQKLIDAEKSFVVALVVNYEGPISGKPGDRAIVTEDGKLWGWVAGGCSQSIIVEEAQKVLRTGIPRMIRISPEPDNLDDKIMKRKMTCHSGGTLDVYLEPVVPNPLIVIMGASAVAQSLIKLSNALDYEVLTGMDDEAIPQSRSIYAVVATQGDGDEAALETALKANPSYLGFVASRKKADAVKEILLSRGVSKKQLDNIKAPAGLDIKARRPEEIALSILAEIVMIVCEQLVEDPVEKQPEQAIDPICGMKVTVDNAKYVFEHQETTYYFCCEGCRTAFERDPEKYRVRS